MDVQTQAVEVGAAGPDAVLADDLTDLIGQGLVHGGGQDAVGGKASRLLVAVLVGVRSQIALCVHMACGGLHAVGKAGVVGVVAVLQRPAAKAVGTVLVVGLRLGDAGDGLGEMGAVGAEQHGLFPGKLVQECVPEGIEEADGVTVVIHPHIHQHEPGTLAVGGILPVVLGDGLTVRLGDLVVHGVLAHALGHLGVHLPHHLLSQRELHRAVFNVHGDSSPVVPVIVLDAVVPPAGIAVDIGKSKRLVTRA